MRSSSTAHACKRFGLGRLHLAPEIDAADTADCVVQDALHHVAADAQFLHAGRAGSPQVVKPPVADAAGIVEPCLEFRDGADPGSGIAGKNQIFRFAAADLVERQLRQLQPVFAAWPCCRLCFQMPPKRSPWRIFAASPTRWPVTARKRTMRPKFCAGTVLPSS